MNHLKQESHHSSIFNCHKQEEKEESTTTIEVLLTAANGDGIDVRSKRLQLEIMTELLSKPHNLTGFDRLLDQKPKNQMFKVASVGTSTAYTGCERP